MFRVVAIHEGKRVVAEGRHQYRTEPHRWPSVGAELYGSPDTAAEAAQAMVADRDNLVVEAWPVYVPRGRT